ncbi:MAG: hypothetical protein AB7O97_20030 [Planctomycetota bacterium]
MTDDHEGIDKDSFDRLRRALPPLEPDTELILRPEGSRAVAMLRPSGRPPRAFVLEGDAARELRLGDDPKLPCAALFADEDALLAALRPALGAVQAPKLIAWRPERRAVLSLRRGDELLFVKFLDKKTYKRAAATFARLGEAAPPLVFARASELLPELCAYAAPAAPGLSLRDHFARGIAPDWDLLERTVQALGRTATTADMPVHDFASARASGVKMLAKAVVLDPRYGEVADRLAALTPPAVTAAGFVHGDFHDKQVFLTDTTAHLIDLEGVGAGDTLFDVANMAEQVRLRALQKDGEDDGLADQLLDRFRFPDSERLRWRVCVRARLCGVYALRPRWSELTSRLLSEVRGILSHCR